MRTSEALKNLWTPGQPTQTSVALVDKNTLEVAERQLRGEPVTNAAAWGRFPVLQATSRLLEQSAQIDGISPWHTAGYTTANELFAATIGEIASAPGQEAIADGLDALYDVQDSIDSDHALLDAMYTALNDGQSYEAASRMATEFPVFNRIGRLLYANRPQYYMAPEIGQPYGQGFEQGVSIYPEILGRLVLAHEAANA